jgi:hypothetical protein
MARNVSLGVLIDDLRAEAGHSLQANLGVAMRDVLVKVLQRQQKRLWEDYDWTFLRVHRDVAVQAGQRYYNFPVDLTLERLEKVEFKYGDRWIPMSYGVDREQYDTHDSDRDVRAFPVERWKEAENDQIEIWPIPSQNGNTATITNVVRFHGIRKLRPLIAEGDVADLDDTLLVLYSAAEILAREKAADASVKLQMAEKHYRTLKGRNAKGETFSLAGGSDAGLVMPQGPKIIAVQTQ